MIFKTDKLDYLQSPKTKLFFESCFSIGQGTSSTGKWNWNLLGFSSFMSILAQCELAPLEAFSSTRKLSLIAVGTRGQGEPCPPYTLKYQLTQSEGGWGTVCPSHYYFTLGLFMLRSFKIQPDEVMNLSNCYFFGY